MNKFELNKKKRAQLLGNFDANKYPQIMPVERTDAAYEELQKFIQQEKLAKYLSDTVYAQIDKFHNDRNSFIRIDSDNLVTAFYILREKNRQKPEKSKWRVITDKNEKLFDHITEAFSFGVRTTLLPALKPTSSKREKYQAKRAAAPKRERKTSTTTKPAEPPMSKKKNSAKKASTGKKRSFKYSLKLLNQMIDTREKRINVAKSEKEALVEKRKNFTN